MPGVKSQKISENYERNAQTNFYITFSMFNSDFQRFKIKLYDVHTNFKSVHITNI